MSSRGDCEKRDHHLHGNEVLYCMRVLYKAFPVAFRQVAFRQATLRERNRSEHVPTSSGCPVPYFMGGYDGFRVVEHDLLELKDAASLYVAGEPEAQRLVLLCAGFPCDHSSFIPLAARLANECGCLVGVSCHMSEFRVSKRTRTRTRNRTL